MKKTTENKIIYQDDKILKFLVESKKHGNFEIIIDIEDWDKVKQYRWGLLYSKTKDQFYIRNFKRVLLHRFILNVKNTKIDVDHKFGNTLDNRKNMMRECNRSYNEAAIKYHGEFVNLN